MDIIKFITDFFQTLDYKDIYKYVLGFISLVILSIFLIFYIQNTIISRYNFQDLNKKRKNIINLVSEYKIMEKKIIHIKDILSLDKNFLIEKAYLDIINKLSLKGNLQENPKVNKAQEDRDNKIQEIELHSSLKGLNMQQLVDLLSKITDIKQVYPKKLDITRSNNQTIDIALTIATVENEKM
jgi:hypothetical protein